MSAPMKKPHTEIQVNLGGKVYNFAGVPSKKLKSIVESLKDFQEEGFSWREQAKNRINVAGGESAYLIKTARQAAGMTQADLAARLKMPQSNISQIEHGKRPVGKNLAKRLAKVFDLDYRVFL